MDELTVRSTSNVSAEVSDIILRQTSTTRLVFRPMLVDNQKLPAAAVKGTFVFQRKSPSKSWDDISAEPLSTLKKDEGYKLALNSSETLKFFGELSSLYDLYAKEGIPTGETEFVRARGALKSLAELSEDRLRVFLEANTASGSALIARLLTWAANAHGVPELVGLLEELGYEALAKLNTAVNVSALKESLELWRSYQEEGNEQFWQELLTSRSFLLEQMFSWPCTIVAEKAYVGGKTVHNTGGHIVDFLVKNRLTTSAALLEIKTPVTKLTGRDYRAGIPNVSGDLAGSIVQVLSYKASLSETYRTLQAGSSGTYEVFDPPCVVIIGRSRELSTVQQKRTFELFRRQLSGGVEVITFDELFSRVEQLIELLHAQTVAPAEEESQWGDSPF
jgi:hypothetical protein